MQYEYNDKPIINQLSSCVPFQQPQDDYPRQHTEVICFNVNLCLLFLEKLPILLADNECSLSEAKADGL